MDWAPGAITGTLALIGVVVAGVLQSRRERNSARYASTTPTPPTTQEVWARLDHVERVLRAAVGVVGELAEQLPDGFQPVLSRRHVALLSDEGYLPPELEHMTNEYHPPKGKSPHD